MLCFEIVDVYGKVMGFPFGRKLVVIAVDDFQLGLVGMAEAEEGQLEDAVRVRDLSFQLKADDRLIEFDRFLKIFDDQSYVVNALFGHDAHAPFL